MVGWASLDEYGARIIHDRQATVNVRNGNPVLWSLLWQTSWVKKCPLLVHDNLPMQRRPRTSRLQKMGAMKRSDHWRVLIREEKPKVFWTNLTQLGCRGFWKQLENSGRILSAQKYGEIKKKTTFVRAKTQITALNQQFIALHCFKKSPLTQLYNVPNHFCSNECKFMII